MNQQSVSYPTPRPLLFRVHGSGFRCTRHVSLQRCHDMASPYLHGVLRDGSPASSILWDAPTPRRPSRPVRILHEPIPPCRPWFAPLGRGRPTGGQGVVGSGLPIRIDDGNVGVSQVPWKPWWSLSVLFDPGRIRQAEWTKSELPDTAPACVHDEGSQRLVLSGLNHTTFVTSLSTLRRMGRPTTTQDSLLAAGPALAGGIRTRRVSAKGFRVQVSSFLPKLT